MKLLIALFFSVQFCVAQHSIKGQFTNANAEVKNVALYKIHAKGAKYLKFCEVKNNSFSFSMDSLAVGMYRVLYVNNVNGFVELIYNDEDVTIELDSKKGKSSLHIIASEENKLLQDYIKASDIIGSQIEDLQIKVLKEQAVTVEDYHDLLKAYQTTQNNYLAEAKNNYAFDFIKANQKYFSPEPQTTYEAFLSNYKAHFLDYIDFKKPKLRSSSMIKDKLLQYVFGITYDENIELMQQNIIAAINDIDAKITDANYKELVFEIIAGQLIVSESKTGFDELMRLYEKLPKEVQNKEFASTTKMQSQTLLTAKAPNFKINETLELYDVDAEQILLVFWSSSCSHCEEEIPEIYKSLKNNIEVKVVAIGLEDEDNVNDWKEKIIPLHGWLHSLAKGKWDHPLADIYNLQATPAFFILNKDKQILFKPYDAKTIADWYTN